MIATFVFTFTNINLAQAEPLQFVGLRELRAAAERPADLGLAAGHAQVRGLALPVAVVLPFVVALMLHSRHLRGPGAFRVLFFLPYVVPFVAGVLIWGGMLNPDTGWINLASRPSGSRTRRPGSTTRRGSTRAS